MTTAHDYDDLHNMVDRRQYLSFTGLTYAEPELAAESEEILGEERGRQAE
ncbi:hypothetical protein [Nocardia donostiensis]|nr:hypothetical protein [Nocardia donostiensis]